MSFIRNNAIWFILGALAILFIVLAILSTGTVGGPDDYVHFRIARYSFKHPSLFLDHWGKPIFTFIASPFAQMGFIGMKIFNIIIGTLTAYLLYQILKIRNYKLNLLAPVFLFFAPIYSVLLLSGMTEIFFSFLLTLTIYLFFREKYIFAAIVASFLPIARTEAIILIPFIIIALAWRKNWKSIPFLFTGFCLYGLIGLIFVYHDFLWLIHQNPYKSKVEAYGSGELLHFVSNLKNLTGLPLLFISIPGFAVALVNLLRKKINLKNPETEEVLLILLPLFTFFAAHSYIWWKGIWASMGLIRVIACIIPLWIFYSVKGLELITSWLGRYKIPYYAFMLILLFFVVITPFKVNQIPVPMPERNIVMKQAAEWLQISKQDRHKIYYFEPYLLTALGKDPFDQNICNEGIFNFETPSKSISDSALIVWEPVFGPKEWRTPLETLMKDRQLKLLNVIRPAVPVIIYGGSNYEVYIFQKINGNQIVDNFEILKGLSETEVPGFQRVILLDNKFERSEDRTKLNADSILSHSGNFSVYLDTINEYSMTFQVSCLDIMNARQGQIKASVFCYPEQVPQKGNIILVVSIENNGRIYDYHAQDFYDLNPAPGKWTELPLNIELPAIKSRNDVLKVYLWQHGKPVCRLDDYRIELIFKR